jgi:hypothetical protein
VKSFSEPKWLNKEYFNHHFKIYVEEGQQKSIVVHRIMSKMTISSTKNDPSVIKHLKQSNTYLRGHFWKEDEVLLKDIGFLASYIPTKHSQEYVIKDMYERSSLSPDVDWNHAPAFKLIHAQPKMKLSGKQKLLKTHAFSVQVKAQDASKMNQFLRNIYKDEHLYMPYTMKRKFPQAVAKAIMQQNKTIKDTWLIILAGVTPSIV